MADLAELAERSGWDGVFLEDYIVYQGRDGMPTYDPWVTLAAMAMATTRIRLGTTVTPLTRRRPWKLASEAVTLDHLSNGRLILGVGLGDRSDPAFGSVGECVEPRAQARIFDEGLEVLDRLWSGEQIDYNGRYHVVHGLRLMPRPLQRPRIPIWIGGDWRLPGVRRRVMRWDGSCCYNVRTARDVEDMLELVERDRGTTAGFDVKVGGKRDRPYAGSLAKAGATWWNDWIPPADAKRTRELIRRGPLRVD
jgi:hypothetical protein